MIRNLVDKDLSISDISRFSADRKDVSPHTTIHGINVYSAAVIVAEIYDISRFASKEKVASYADPVSRQDQSGNRDIKGHISKHGPPCSGSSL